MELRRWWPGREDGRPEPVPAEHQRVPALGGRRGPGPPRHGAGGPPRRVHVPPLPRAPAPGCCGRSPSLALDRHADAYEEIRPPTLVLTETMTSTGHLPEVLRRGLPRRAGRPVGHPHRRGAADLDAPRRDPRRGRPAGPAHRGDPVLPPRGRRRRTRHPGAAAGARVREGGALRLRHAPSRPRRPTPTSWPGPRACCGSSACATGCSTCAPATSGASSARTFDLEVYSPGCDRWLEVSSVSWFRDYQARRANVRYRPAGGGAPVLAHTVNGSALAWARIWAALVESGRRPDGSVAAAGVPGAVARRRARCSAAP